jgi:hypothetical protein
VTPALHPRQALLLEISRAENDIERSRCRCYFECSHDERRVQAAGRLMKFRALARDLDAALVRPIVTEARS